MLRALRKYGGVAFADFNTFLLRPLGVDVADGLVVAGQAVAAQAAGFALGLHVMQAPAGHPFVEFLERELTEMVERDDPRLHQMPLEDLMGQVVLDKYQQEQRAHHSGSGDVNATAGDSIFDGVVVGTADLFGFDGLHDLLTAKMGQALAGKFRGVAGFHVDKYDFNAHTADTSDLNEIERMQKELTLADEWQNLDTLLGAVVRLAVTANTTAELQPLFV
ncbi:unnamed protein product [Phytophthora lilii]|uniref:Unnamed protein product n=1 Tax=Phytophthora lilii TaxID=2077276 RepID=A0A9W6YKJ7_9STRA|nr:unnamed protein product [Phytophthora lilii]